jgi:hypothetical protein
MNTFKTTDLGGLGLRSNDFRFIDASVREAFFGTLSYLGDLANSVIIISGCEVVPSLMEVTILSGFVLLNGEVFKVDTHSYPNTTPGVRYWDIDITYDAEGTKLFKDSTTHETYEIRRAKTFFAPTLPVDKIAFSSTLYYFDILKEKLGFIASTAWANIPFCSNMFPGPSGQGKFMIDSNGFVHLKGAYTNDDPGAGAVLGVLPLGFRPPESQFSRLSDGSGGDFELEMKTDGSIYVATSCPQLVYLNQIPAFKV